MLPFSTYIIPDTTTNETVQVTKRLFFVLNESPTDQQNDLIRKISAALKADYDQDVFMSIFSNESPLAFTGWSTHSMELIISFGVTPAALGLWIDLTTPGIRFLEDFTFILSLPISELEKNANAKKTLWNHMQLFMEMKARQDA